MKHFGPTRSRRSKKFVLFALLRQSFRHLGISSILTVIQLFFGLIALLVAVGLLFGLGRLSDLVQTLEPVSTISVNVDLGSGARSDAGIATYRKLLKVNGSIRHSASVQGVGLYFVSSLFGFVPTGQGSAVNDDFKDVTTIPVALVNDSFAENMRLPSTGEPLLSSNLFPSRRSDRIPLWVGSALASRYPIGTLLTSVYVNMPYVGQSGKLTVQRTPCQVVGIIASGSVFWASNGGNVGPDSLQSVSDMILAPMTLSDMSRDIGSATSILSLNMEIYPKPGMESSARAEALAVIRRAGLHGEASSVSGQLMSVAREQRPIILSTWLVAGTLIVLSVLGHISVLLASLVKRRQEFGIRLMVGSKKWQLVRLVLIETVSLYLLALVVPFILSLGLSSLLANWLILIDARTVLIAVAVTGGISLLACALPMWRISRLHVIQLVQGE